MKYVDLVTRWAWLLFGCTLVALAVSNRLGCVIPESEDRAKLLFLGSWGIACGATYLGAIGELFREPDETWRTRLSMWTILASFIYLCIPCFQLS